MTVRRRLWVGTGIVTSWAVVQAQGCSSDDAPGAPPPATTDDGGTSAADATTQGVSFTETSPGVLEAKVHVVAAAGASIALPGEAAFDIPPGALAQDTDITISVPKDQSRASRFQSFEFEPTGLVFSKPATLRVPYEQVGGKDPAVRGWAGGDSNPLVSATSEVTDREPMKLLARNAQARTIDFEIPHFTFFNVLIQVDDLLYVVPVIPPKYLSPGDMLFVLTQVDKDKGPHWNPGHVAMFVGGGQACSNQYTDGIIESTPASDSAIESAIKARDEAIKLGKPAPPIPIDGVQRSSLLSLRTGEGHFYLGARRPGDGQPLTASDRTNLVGFATTQLGDEYCIVGQGNIAEGSWSCVGLVEAAYDSIGRGSMGAVREAFGGTPIELYWNTKPVEEITVGVGDNLEMFVQGTVVHPDSMFHLFPGDNYVTDGWYCDSYPCGSGTKKTSITYSVQGQPTAAQFIKHGWRYSFNYIAPPEDAGKSFDVVFTASAPIYSETPLGTFGGQTETRTTKVRINVVPCASPDTPPACAPTTQTPEERTACIVSGGNSAAVAAATTAPIPLPAGGTHKHSNRALLEAPTRGPVDLVGAMAFFMSLSPEEYTAAFGNTYLPCGAGNYGLTLCGSAQGADGDWVLASARMYDEIPIADPHNHYQYAFVFDQDDTTTNNYRAQAPYLGDYFDDTDRWYEAVYAPGTGWQLKTRDANQLNQVTSFASAARFNISRDTITLAVPRSELSAATPKFRVTAFTHKGDFGINPPHEYSADTYPHVGQALAPVPTQ